jgi:hypothetical protein
LLERLDRLLGAAQRAHNPLARRARTLPQGSALEPLTAYNRLAYPFWHRLIPTRADHHALDALAQSRRPMDMMSQGWSMSLFQASQQWSTMAA